MQEGDRLSSDSARVRQTCDWPQMVSSMTLVMTLVVVVVVVEEDEDEDLREMLHELEEHMEMGWRILPPAVYLHQQQQPFS